VYIGDKEEGISLLGGIVLHEKHHRIPKSRIKETGIQQEDERNIFTGWCQGDGKHAAWHALVRNKTPEEALITLIQRDVHGCVITDRLLITAFLLFSPLFYESVWRGQPPQPEEALLLSLRKNPLWIGAPINPRQTRRVQRRRKAWQQLFGNMSGQSAFFWVIENMFPPTSFYFKQIQSPIVRALSLTVFEKMSTKEALREAFRTQGLAPIKIQAPKPKRRRKPAARHIRVPFRHAHGIAIPEISWTLHTKRPDSVGTLTNFINNTKNYFFSGIASTTLPLEKNDSILALSASKIRVFASLLLKALCGVITTFGI